MSPRPPVNVPRDKAVEVFIYTVTLTLLVIIIIGSHLVVWDDMNQREALRMRRARKGTMPISAIETHEPLGLPAPTSMHDYPALAERAASLCALDDTGLSVFFAIISRESSWRMYDKHGAVLRSHSGALGLTQVKPATAREMGPSDPRTPWGNLLLGACYLRKQYDRFGTWERAVLAYRVGPRGVATVEAKRYVADVMEGVE